MKTITTHRVSIILALLAALLLTPTLFASNEPPQRVHAVTSAAPLHTNDRSGSTFTNGGSADKVDWTNIANAAASDNQRATAVLQTIQTSKWLRATGFGFNIPDTATIRGVLVEVETSSGLPGGMIQHDSIRLIVGGTIQGNNNAGGYITTTDTYLPYGSETDLWGLTLTPADVNAADFGVATRYIAMLDDTVRVDHIRMTIYFSSRVYENSDSAITYGAGWTTTNDTRASGGSYRTRSQTGSTACLTFSGADRVGVGRAVGTNQGKMRVTVDGSAVNGSPFDSYISYSDAYPTTMHSFLWAAEGLTTASHTICVEPDGTKNASSSSTQIGFDYFVIAVGSKMAQRGVVEGLSPMIQSDVNAYWNYARDDGGLEPDTNTANWNGFIPKVSGEGTTITTSQADQVISSAQTHGAPVPAYWIFFNEPDNSFYGNHPPTDQATSDNLAQSIVNIKARYEANSLPAPKFIIESGSQCHAPRGTIPHADDAWTQDPCGPDANNIDPVNAHYWACYPNRDGIWIDQFWNKFSAEYPNLVADIGGFGGHYYQRADWQNCALADCALKPDRVLQFAQALKDWENSKGLGDREIWLIETATGIVDGDCAGGDTFAAQVDGFSCAGQTRNVRNYVSELQDALAQQGIVNRWAWYADRYGSYHECSAGGPTDQSFEVQGKSDGEFSALNSACTGATVKSPFGINFSQAAQYR